MWSLDNLKYKFKALDVFEKIIAINAIVFFVTLLFRTLIPATNTWSIFSLPSDALDFITQPWSLLTYGFVHYRLFHVLFNLVILYYVSRIMLNILRPKMALNIYLLGIIVGGIAFLLVYNLVPKYVLINTSSVVGASAGISALLIFLGVYLPETEARFFVFTLKLKHIALILVLIDVLGLFGWNQGGNVAHLGGALLGYLYASKLKQGKDIGEGFERFMDSVFGWFKSKSNLKTVHRKPHYKAYAGKTKEEFHTFNDQKKIDLILDKISKSGYDSLTAEEKAFLFKAGKQ